MCRDVAAIRAPEQSGTTVISAAEISAAPASISPTPGHPPPPAAAGPDRTAPSTVQPRAAAEAATPGSDPATGVARRGCVLLDARRGPIKRRALEAAAGCVRRGGIIAVLTVSHHDGGRLHDPRPVLVATAAAAGLAYLQHIVTITRHTDPDTTTTTEDAGWGLGPDVSLFRRPTDEPDTPTPDDAAPDDGAGLGHDGAGLGHDGAGLGHDGDPS